jgi:hypothetical protein
MRWTRATRLRLAAMVIALGGAVGAAVLPASPAVAFFSPPLFLDVTPQSPAHLVAGGAAVDVTVEFTCAGASGGGFLTVSVTEGVGGGVAAGSAQITIACAPQKQRTVVTVPATSGGRAFKTGSALASGQVFACATTFCGSEQDQETIRIKR